MNRRGILATGAALLAARGGWAQVAAPGISPATGPAPSRVPERAGDTRIGPGTRLGAGPAAGLGADPSLLPLPSASLPFARLQDGAPFAVLAPEQLAERVADSPAPPGAPGQWTGRAMLPVARSEMAWAAAWDGRMHVIGGYGEGRVDRAYHHVYDPDVDLWFVAAPLPRGANHVAVAADAGRVYALGGFTQQNRDADGDAYAYDVAYDQWTRIAPLPRPRGAAVAVALNGRIYLIGGASQPASERASIAWVEVYDPIADKWAALAPLPGARDHAGAVAHEGRLHVVGGRFNGFEHNTGLHHAYLPDHDAWEERAPLPTPRSGHGLVAYRGRFFAMGGEGARVANGAIADRHVFGQMESYDPEADSWLSHAPLPTPRHAVAAALLGERIHVAGGGAVTGGAIQSAVHEAFTLPEPGADEPATATGSQQP